MTMPSERTRSIIQAREFLVDLSRDKTLPEAVRTEARRLLRHYPTADEVLLVAADAFLPHMPEIYCPCLERRTRCCISLFRLLGWVSIASAPGSKMHRRQHMASQAIAIGAVISPERFLQYFAAYHGRAFLHQYS